MPEDSLNNFTISQEKQALRQEMIEKRRGLPRAVRERAAIEVVPQVMEVVRTRKPTTILAYCPLPEEIDLSLVIKELWDRELVVVFPRVGNFRALTIHSCTGWADFEPGSFNLKEPYETVERVEPQDIDLAIVPGVAFDREGHRLGFGGGYFDRFLPTLRDDCYTIAPCFAMQVLDHIPFDTHDRTVDEVIAV